MTKVKLCGLFQLQDIKVVNQLQPDYIGFVFYEKSHRNLTKEKAKALKANLVSSIQAVGVFVDADLKFITELYREHIIDVAQLHGHEDEAYIKALREMSDIPIFQAFKITSIEDVKKANASTADSVLLDAGKGTGTTFDWRLLDDINRDYFLAGGLSVENAKEAVKRFRPYGVDVSSGIETDKKKDPDKMKLFLELVRDVDQENAL